MTLLELPLVVPLSIQITPQPFAFLRSKVAETIAIVLLPLLQLQRLLFVQQA